MRHLSLNKLTVAILIFCFSISSHSIAKKRKSGDNLSVEIKNKKYPRRKKLEVTGDFGGILNQSYINSLLVHTSFTYFTSESMGFGADFALAMNTDKSERICIENFYNDFDDQDIANVCAKEGDPATAKADVVNTNGNEYTPNMGPAYPPIRELNYLISGHMVWSPVYGKQLFFMSGVAHFDIFLTMGGGVAINNLYPFSNTSPSGDTYRGKLPEKSSTEPPPGVSPDDETQYGKNARPEPTSETTPMITFGVGQKVHITKNLNFRMEARNYTLVGTDNIFETYFAAWAGLGLRF